jgi:hypothetical protein
LLLFFKKEALSFLSFLRSNAFGLAGEVVDAGFRRHDVKGSGAQALGVFFRQDLVGGRVLGWAGEAWMPGAGPPAFAGMT